MVQWHQQKEVDDFVRHTKEAGYKRQGIRSGGGGGSPTTAQPSARVRTGWRLGWQGSKLTSSSGKMEIIKHCGCTEGTKGSMLPVSIISLNIVFPDNSVCMYLFIYRCPVVVFCRRLAPLLPFSLSFSGVLIYVSSRTFPCCLLICPIGFCVGFAHEYLPLLL